MISILMPAYNASKYIDKSIESILAQSHTDFELLICDDCSTDDTWTKISSFNDHRIKRYKNTENLGYLKTSNFLISKAQGMHISFQDADDYSSPERFLRLIDHLKRYNLDLVGSYCTTFVENDKPLSTIKYSIENNDIYDDILNKPTPPFCGSAILVSINVIKECGLYDPNFDRIGGEDFDWIYRISLKKFKMGNVPESLYNYRQHSEGVSKVNFQKNILALHSADIAKDLYLARLNSNFDFDFDYFSSKYLSQGSTISDQLLYQNLHISLYSNRSEATKEFLNFLLKSKSSKRKVKTLAIAFTTIIFGYERTETLKGWFR